MILIWHNSFEGFYQTSYIIVVEVDKPNLIIYWEKPQHLSGNVLRCSMKTSFGFESQLFSYYLWKPKINENWSSPHFHNITWIYIHMHDLISMKNCKLLQQCQIILFCIVQAFFTFLQSKFDSISEGEQIEPETVNYWSSALE